MQITHIDRSTIPSEPPYSELATIVQLDRWHRVYGLRVVPRSEKLAVGTLVPVSAVWADGRRTGKDEVGAWALLTAGGEPCLRRAFYLCREYARLHADRRGLYRLALLGSRYMHTGAEDFEAIMIEARCLWQGVLHLR